MTCWMGTALCFTLWYVFPVLSWLTVNHTRCSHCFLEWVFLALVCLDLFCSLPVPAMAPRSTPTSPASFLPLLAPSSLSLPACTSQGPVSISILFFLYKLALGYHVYHDDLCYHLGTHESQTFYSLCLASSHLSTFAFFLQTTECFTWMCWKPLPFSVWCGPPHFFFH